MYTISVFVHFFLNIHSELIQKYRQKESECEQYKQQLKDVQTKLSIEEKGRKGLLAEFSVLHQVNGESTTC